ncbi:copper resistance CopC/CopD family protein [Saccharothrix stipae]
MPKLLVAVLAVAGWLLLSAPQALAHAELAGSAPANGEHLASAPREVVLRFTEPVTLTRDGIAVLGRSGQRVETAPAVAESTRVRVPLPDGLADGVYSVTWRVLSPDSHPVHGAFVFSVGAAQAAPLAGEDTLSGADGAVAAVFWLVRWIGFGAIALLIGGTFFLTTCWRPDRRAERVLRTAWVTALASTTATLLLHGVNATGAPLTSVFDLRLLADTITSRYGLLVSARLVLLAIAGVLRKRGTTRAAAVVAVALVATWSSTGHAVTGDWPVLAVALDMAHLLAMSVWLGGLALLCACVLWRRDPGAGATRALHRFSRAALVPVVVLLVSGGLLAVRNAGTSGLLSGSSYASLVVFKVGGFAVLAWLAWLSAVAVRQGATGSVKRSAGVEVLVAAAVLGLTAALVVAPPADRVRPTPVAAVTGPYLDAHAIPDGDVQVWVSPARVGDNQVVVNVRDRHGVNREVPEVTARLSLAAGGVGPLVVPLAGAGPGRYVADRVTVPMPGTWRLEVRVRTSEFEVSTVDAEVAVA